MKFAVIVVPCFLLFSVRSVVCARILGFFPIPSISHQVVFRRVMNELWKRGHHVTVATPDPAGIRSENYTEIDLHFIYKPFRDAFPEVDKTIPERPMWEAYEVLADLVDLELSHEPVKRLLREGSFDLVIVEILLLPAVTALSHHFKAPFIGIASLDVFVPTHELIGNPFNPAYYPEMILPYTNKKDFYARFRSTLTYLFWKLAYKYRWLPKHDAIAKKHFGPDTPYIEDVEKNVSMIFANTDFRITYPYPTVPAYLQIGGGRPIHMVEQKPLLQSRPVIMALVVLGLVLCAKILASDGSDILALFPTPSYSHQIVYRSYVLELVKRGHNITVITTDPINATGLNNYREIDMSASYESWNKRFKVASETAKFLRWIPEVLLFAFSDFMDEMCHAYLSHPEVNKLIRDEIRFDLFVVEFGVSSCFYPFARQSRNNYIGIFSMTPMSFVHANAGNPAAPTHLPDPLLGKLSSLTFPERVRATIFQAVAWVVYFRTMRSHHEIASKYFGADLPPLHVYERNVSVLLLNDHFTVTFPRPAAPGVVHVGGPALQLVHRTPNPLPKVQGIRILAVLPTPSFSHHIFYNRYLLELHKRGHDITVATPYPVDDANLTGYRQIDFSHLKSYWNDAWHGKFEKENVKSSILKMGLLVSEIILEIHRVYSTHPEMRAIVEKGEVFDLFVSEWSIVNPSCPYARFANYSVGITSFDLEPLSGYEMGGTANPAYVPCTNAPYSDRMTLFQRLSNTCSYIILFLLKVCLNLIFDTKNREYFGPNVPSMFALEKKVNLILTNSHFTAQTPKPFATNVIPIGGPPFHLQGYDLRPLPQDLQRFLDDAKEGVIYFSLGSNVKSEAMPENKRQVFLRAFSRLKQKVLWKWEAGVLPGKPDNVKIGKWLPQTEILAHPNVRAFITQGGLQSVSEAVFYTKPMIVIPFFADQELNAKKLVSERVAIKIDYDNLELDSFIAALHEILNDSGYKERIVKYSALTQDQPQSPLERAVWWTEYVIRHKGAKHLRSAAVDMPWYQYFLLDVFAFILAVLSITCYALYKVFSLVFRLLFGKNKAKKE